MSYIEITGKCEEADESSYTNRTTGEIVTKIQLSLVLPSMRDRLQVELPLDKAPKPDILERWELEEAWVVVSCESMRALTFERSNARAGEKATGALVVFQGVEAREAFADERKQLQAARKVQKVAAKQRRAQRQAEKDAAKAAEKDAATQGTPASAQQSA